MNFDTFLIAFECYVIRKTEEKISTLEGKIAVINRMCEVSLKIPEKYCDKLIKYNGQLFKMKTRLEILKDRVEKDIRETQS